jgi:hypothetical protein
MQTRDILAAVGVLLFVFACAALAEDLRVATWNMEWLVVF